MPKENAQHVFKYLAAEDRFVRIRVLTGAPRLVSDDDAGPASLDARTYRRLVVASYVADVDETTLDDERIEALFGLVLDVHPELDLAKVRLPDTPPTVPGPGLGEASHTRQVDPAAAFRRRLRRLSRDVEVRLGRRVVGQDRALGAVGRAVRRAALGWDRSGPLATLLSIGPTGTGKTEIARALAAELGGEELLIRVDCTEFSDGHEVAKLLGAPPGYIGFEERGLLARGLERAPRGVLLFDEVEKAHGRLHDVLLQILDEGHVTDGRGEKLDLTQSFVLLTSNAGTRELTAARDALGFGAPALDVASRDEIVRRALDERFRPEFLARLDELVLFDDLERDALLEIARERLGRLAAQVRRGGRRACFSGAVARWIADRALESDEGARGVLHVLKREVEAPLAEEVLDARRGTWIDVSVRGGQLRFVPRAA